MNILTDDGGGDGDEDDVWLVASGTVLITVHLQTHYIFTSASEVTDNFSLLQCGKEGKERLLGNLPSGQRVNTWQSLDFHFSNTNLPLEDGLGNSTGNVVMDV